MASNAEVGHMRKEHVGWAAKIGPSPWDHARGITRSNEPVPPAPEATVEELVLGPREMQTNNQVAESTDMQIEIDKTGIPLNGDILPANKVVDRRRPQKVWPS